MDFNLLYGTKSKNLFYSRTSFSIQEKSDWDFFSKIFYVKEYSLFEYQTRTLLDEPARMAKWTDEEDFMLYSIIIRDRRAKWN